MDRRKAVSALGAGALAFPLRLRAQAAAEGYRFSPVNQYGLQLTASYWNPIIEYAAAASGVKMQLKIGRTSADTTGYVLAQEVDFAFTNHLFSPDRERMGWKVLARRDAPPVHGQLVVPEASPIRTLAQLKDLEVAFPGPEAFVAYKVPYAHLLALGVPVKVVFGGNMDSALTQLVSGKVAAVGGNSQLIEGFARREGRAMRVLWSSEPYHDLALMSSPRVKPAEAEAVRRAFIGMATDPAGRRVLEQASKAVQIGNVTGFVSAGDHDYDSYRRFYATAPSTLR
ncbi:MAG: phosphate/phosphite/phosphonate ABC transporter substrate-binding protein [Rubrivivax sp.]|jgi:phosphonate transport system substrate-binding protein|nr:phosphate/phosphite/phosphonate ABC transporter substrate-binding protein [Rubrivivax sp.]